MTPETIASYAVSIMASIFHSAIVPAHVRDGGQPGPRAR